MSEIDDLAPHSVEAEQSVLGSILLNADALYDVKHRLQPEDFYLVKHGWIYAAILQLEATGEAIDPVSIGAQLDPLKLKDIGGAAYLTRLINETPTHIHAATYGGIVERCAIRRRLIAAAQTIARLALEDESTTPEIAAQAVTLIAQAAESRDTGDICKASDLASAYYDRIVDLREGKRAVLGVPTGFQAVDRVVSGWQPGTFNLVAGRPGKGKTGFILSSALAVAQQHTGAVMFFSLEMSPEQLTNRAISSLGQIDGQNLRLGRLSAEEFDKFQEATAKFSTLPILIKKPTGITVPQMITICRQIQQRHGLALVCVDYVQLVKAATLRKSGTRENEVSEVSRALKELAMTLDVPVLAAAQLSRDIDKREAKRPVLSDLRESGSLEQDADIVMFISDPTTPDGNHVNLIIAKHRAGPTADIPLLWHPQFTLFSSDVKVLQGGYR